METNLWEKLGNRCLELAIAELDKETVPIPAEMETVERLVRIAISLDEPNLQWANQSRYGAAVFAGRPLPWKGADKLNPVYKFIKEILETTDMETVAKLLASNDWIAICAARNGDGTYLFSLARVR